MYITTYTNPFKKQQKTSYLKLMQNYSDNDIDVDTMSKDEYQKITYKIENPKPYTQLSAKQQADIYKITECIEIAFRWVYTPYTGKDLKQFYNEFKIPKATGGLRTINAPTEQFKTDLNKIKALFEENIKCLPHDSAYAYVKTRDTKQALQKHKDNESKWFLKIDLKDFFPSCHPTVILNKLSQLYPFYYLHLDTLTKLGYLIDLCCLDGGLPQGTPTSPLLTNLVMVAYDYEITEYLRKKGEGYVYTRYADDILISNKCKFNWKNIVTDLTPLLQPFTIKREKTRFGSLNGRNWNLGLMYNKDNNITLGYKKKQLLNAILHNFLRDFSKNTPWSKEDTYHLQGQLSYLKHIEPDYYNYIVQKYETKYNTSLYRAISTILNPKV